eukprot:TRINITY_DN6556_c0_g1_i6.p1 TRINITY_DN6556_c0_g1~~TRINITY_DN6556_c0_g1_i6.p1  ORF type:complete len:260 (-),score=68.27 TRINITY_DN6556_c0_g1_i6:113-892(-)
MREAEQRREEAEIEMAIAMSLALEEASNEASNDASKEAGNDASNEASNDASNEVGNDASNEVGNNDQSEQPAAGTSAHEPADEAASTEPGPPAEQQAKQAPAKLAPIHQGFTPAPPASAPPQKMPKAVFSIPETDKRTKIPSEIPTKPVLGHAQPALQPAQNETQTPIPPSVAANNVTLTEMDRRAQYLRHQRDKLKEAQLTTKVQPNQSTSTHQSVDPVRVAASQAAVSANYSGSARLDMRAALARRFKQDMLNRPQH